MLFRPSLAGPTDPGEPPPHTLGHHPAPREPAYPRRLPLPLRFVGHAWGPLRDFVEFLSFTPGSSAFVNSTPASRSALRMSAS